MINEHSIQAIVNPAHLHKLKISQHFLQSGWFWTYGLKAMLQCVGASFKRGEECY